jgi:hypothetical protein
MARSSKGGDSQGGDLNVEHAAMEEKMIEEN